MLGSLKKFLNTILSEFNYLDGFGKQARFSQSEINEILKNSKSENLEYFQELSKLKELSSFEISFLLSSVKLDEGKIEIIKKACKTYNEKEFKQMGQTFSDFIFRVGKNLDLIDMNNFEIFKELAQVQNEVYDFKNILKNPCKLKAIKKEPAFAFEKIYIEN